MAKRSSMKLATLSVAELLQLRDEVQTALSGKIQMERDELQEKLDQLTRMETSGDGLAAAVRGSRKSGRGANGAGSARKGGARDPSAHQSTSGTMTPKRARPIQTGARWRPGCEKSRKPAKTSRRSTGFRNRTLFPGSSLT